MESPVVLLWTTSGLAYLKFLNQLSILRAQMNTQHPEIGVCGLSCRLCPMYNAQTSSRCGGCKSPGRIAVGCPFISCAVKKKGIEFCWECTEENTCERWRKHREAGKRRDSFKCYQKLEDDIAFIREHGVAEFEKEQKIREHFLEEMLQHFNDGRSKSYYCIASTVMKIDELKDALTKARIQSRNLQPNEKAKVMHSILDSVSKEKGYLLKLRK